ncbi:COG4315 family predicted lipoprotein [Jatrophihabitans sp. DSM 45814]
MMLKTRNIGLVSLAAASLAMGAACSSSGDSSSSTTSAPAAATTGGVVSAQSSSLGTILVDGSNRTVYVFANDTANTSNCNAACAADWPPVAAPTPLPTSVAGVTGMLGSITRSDGSKQLTVATHPVYTFAGDSAPGQTKGQGVNLNGGVWTVVSPAGAPVSGSNSGAATSTGNGY